MIERLLPDQVRWAEAFEHRADHPLFAEEEALVARAVEKRRREFASARACARAALVGLGIAPGPILRGERGEPLWPAGAVGSLTHCDGYCAAAVAPVPGEIVALGIDAEPHLPLPHGVLDLVSGPPERARIAELARTRPEVRWDRLLFCAKEATYKAWFPLTGRWLGFEEAEVSVDPVGGTFSSALSVPGPEVDGHRLRAFTGRWLVDRGLVITAIAVPAGARPPVADPPVVPGDSDRR